MTAKEKFDSICESLNNTGCGEVQISEVRGFGDSKNLEATFICRHIFVSVTLRPSGYLHPRTSCKVFASVKGKKTDLRSAFFAIRNNI
jgi:nitrogen regulatory protein PII